ncbi:MAG: carboxymuconolactone decarboxylase family protein [Oceanicoccus sp.]
MTRIQTAPAERLDEVGSELELMGAAMGFEANSLKVMAHRPAILRGFMALAGSILGPDSNLDRGLRQMIAYITSAASGCRYCQAHTSHGAEVAGIDVKKLESLWLFETSDLFDNRERAALSLALAAGQVPNMATDDHFTTLSNYFSDEEITEIVAVISLFGFLNRWNDTLATQLEKDPQAFAETHLKNSGWEIGNHS